MYYCVTNFVGKFCGIRNISQRKKISSGTEWEKLAGYSRAVKSGNHIFIAGTTSVNENGDITGKGDVYLQTKFILGKIEAALKQCGSSLEDIVRTRMFITDISRWEEAAKAHGEVFGSIRPASTLIEVSSLVDKNLLIEIEADAIAG
jgi:enamine deaminase RidA (YjgF/YER057c/UK114 family)